MPVTTSFGARRIAPRHEHVRAVPHSAEPRPQYRRTLDAKVFFHKLHMGASLPSVIAGTPYVPAKNSFGTFDYSTVVFPADPGDPRRCEICHSQTTGAAQATAYLTNPTRAACGSCHDDVNFATGVNHPGGPQFDDNQCANCHIPQGEMDFDASIKGAHVAPTASTLLTRSRGEHHQGIKGGTAGSAPVVFVHGSGQQRATGFPLSRSARSRSPWPDPPRIMATPASAATSTTPGYVTESAAKARPAITAATALYVYARGSGRMRPAPMRSAWRRGGPKRCWPGRPSSKASHTERRTKWRTSRSMARPSRRGAGGRARNCNRATSSLQLHGTLRNNTEYCVLCHNPSNTDAQRAPAATVAADKAAPPQGINFNLLVHRIHYGINMQASESDAISWSVSAEATTTSASTLFPALSPTGAATDTENCSLCHVNSQRAEPARRD